MSSVRAPRPASYEDVLRAPSHLIAQVAEGVLETQPRPGGRHQYAVAGLGDELGPPFRRGRGGPGGWLILEEPELHLGRDILVPDLAGWHVSRAPNLDEAFFTIAPDWICEVLSPGTARFDRIRKMPVYGGAGVKHGWLVDPLAKTLEVFRLEAGHWVVVGAHGEDERVRAQPFDAIELELGLLWAPDAAPSQTP